MEKNWNRKQLRPLDKHDFSFVFLRSTICLGHYPSFSPLPSTKAVTKLIRARPTKNDFIVHEKTRLINSIIRNNYFLYQKKTPLPLSSAVVKWSSIKSATSTIIFYWPRFTKIPYGSNLYFKKITKLMFRELALRHSERAFALCQGWCSKRHLLFLFTLEISPFSICWIKLNFSSVQTCKAPPQPRYGKFTPDRLDRYQFANIVQYRCDYGFSVRGHKTTKCLIYGNWSNPAPKCISK